jgi:glycosyltransferase involved in cell wall biosynthesis
MRKTQMHSSSPYFSVIVTTHNRPKLLERALNSLRNQSFSDFEIIVVSDCDDAETYLVASKSLQNQDVFIKRNTVPGPSESRNLGISLTSGKWIVFLDDDDTYGENHLKNLYQASIDTKSDVLYSDFFVITENRETSDIEPISKQFAPISTIPVEGVHVKNFIPNNTLAYRANIIKRCTFDKIPRSQEDWEFILNICSICMPTYYAGGEAIVHKDNVSQDNQRGKQADSQNTWVISDFLYIYKKWPAPTVELKAQRQALLTQVGLGLPIEWF